MKIEAEADGELVLKEIYGGVYLETDDGNRIGVCMRDDTFEINVIPVGESPNSFPRNWWRVNMQTGLIEKL